MHQDIEKLDDKAFALNPKLGSTTFLASGFAVIDFEASSLSLSEWPELSSYPIEAGVALVESDGAISTWSSLIRPDRLWRANGEWDPKSQRVHGISLEALNAGQSPSDVAHHLNTILENRDVWCDGGAYDQHWMNVLYRTAGASPTFTLRDISELFNRNAQARTCYLQIVSKGTRQHRAAQDAADIAAHLLELKADEIL